jgi:hypothetical protein
MASLVLSVDKEKLKKKYALLNDVEKELQRLAPLIELTRPAIEKIKPNSQQQQQQQIRARSNILKIWLCLISV